LRDFCLGEDGLFDEAGGVEDSDSWVVLDSFVHQGLGVGGFVAFVVAVAAEADEVDDDVLVEFVAVVEGDLEDAPGSFGVVGVDVEDGDLDYFRHVS